MDFYQSLGALILGTRFKRLSEKYLSEVSKVYQSSDIPFDASWFPIFYLLSDHKESTLIEISQQLGVSHSAISQMASNLEKRGLIQTSPDQKDKRKRIARLSEEGESLYQQVKPIWEAMSKAFTELIEEGENSSVILKAVTELELNMDKKPLSERILEKVKIEAQ